MNPIHVLWATPRSTSTAFEWMMRMRGDMACFHEPFGEAWYQGDEALWPRLEADSPRQPGLTCDSVLTDLKTAAKKKPVFSKDMPQFTDHLWTDEFLATFQHSFLIRDPAKVLTSVHKNWPEFVMKEIGFIELRDLFDRLSEMHGGPMPVIDSDDLLEDPHGIVEAYCKAMGFPYISEALSWEPGARNEVLWYDKNSVWHKNLMNSDGLKPQPRKAGSIADEPDWVKEIYEVCLPIYEYLHQFRLTASG